MSIDGFVDIAEGRLPLAKNPISCDDPRKKKEFFEEQGFVIVREIIDDTDIAHVLETYETAKADLKTESRAYAEETGNWVFVPRDFEDSLAVDAYLKSQETIANRPRMLELVESLKPSFLPVTFSYHAAVMHEIRSDGTVMHTESFYYKKPVMNIWTPLIPMDEKTSLLYAFPRSHLDDDVRRAMPARDQTKNDEQYGRELFNAVKDKYDIQLVPLNPGDVVVLSGRVVHGSTNPQDGSIPRHSMNLEYHANKSDAGLFRAGYHKPLV